MIRIEHLFISPGHNFYGHQDQPAGEHPLLAINEIECVAGRGAWRSLLRLQTRLQGANHFLRPRSTRKTPTRTQPPQSRTSRHPPQRDHPRHRPQHPHRHRIRNSRRALLRSRRMPPLLLDEHRARHRRGNLAARPRRPPRSHSHRRLFAPQPTRLTTRLNRLPCASSFSPN